MPVVEAYTTSVSANTTTEDILLGKKLNAAPSRGVYRILGRHAAAVGTVVMDIWRGSEQIAEGMPMQALAGGPNATDDLLTEFGALGGEKIMIKLRETAGTNTVPTIKVMFQAL